MRRKTGGESHVRIGQKKVQRVIQFSRIIVFGQFLSARMFLSLKCFCPFLK